MKWRTQSWLVRLGAGLFSLTANATDPIEPPAAPLPAMQYGYDVPGQVHNDPTLKIRSIVLSEREVEPPRNGMPQNLLTYRVCNIEPGDKPLGRPPEKLYFNWPDAGFRVAVLRELPFEHCAKFMRKVSGEVQQGTSDILYTYRRTAIPAQDIWTMSWMPPWSKPSKYWDHGIAVYEDLTKGMKNPQNIYSIHITRKGPEDPGAHQMLGWKPGTQLYLALPRLTSEQLLAYQTSLGGYEGQGVIFSIRPAEALIQEFEQDSWVMEGFEGRDVLKIEMTPDREKGKHFNSVQVEVPTSVIDLIQLQSVLRERSTERAMYQAVYVISGT